jgi:type II secretory pathway component PulF
MTSKVELILAKVQFGFQQRIRFYQEFAALLRSGMSKPEAVQLLALVASDEGRKKGEAMSIILSSVLRDMQNGQSFGEAIKRWVPSDDRMVLEASENSDDFPGQLEQYCWTLRQKRKVVGTIIGGLTYPTFLFTMVFAMLVYFGRVIVPDIAMLLPVDQWRGMAAFLAFLGRFAENYALYSAFSIVCLLVLITFSLPRWTGTLRRFADYLPIYKLYRVYTGISFMLSVSSLMRGGTAPIVAVERVLPLSTPYVRERLLKIRRGMLNGLDFGEALHKFGRTWPDYKMNLSIKIFSRTQDLSSSLANLSQDWLRLNQEKMEQRMAAIRNLALVLVFAVIMAVVGGMYSLQSQIAEAVQR